MAGLYAQPCITPPDYDTVDFPAKKEILMAQKSAVYEYERCRKAALWLGKKYRRRLSILVA
jgi:hypothetical protein